MQKKKIIKNSLIAITTIVLIYLILENVSVTQVSDNIRAIGLKTLLLCFAIHFFVFVFRSWPMSVIIKQVPFITMLNAHLIHNFYLQIVPASLGELTLPELLKDSIQRSETLLSLIVARLYSIMVVMAIFATSTLVLLHDFHIIKLEIKHLYIWAAIGFVLLASGILSLRKRIMKIGIIQRLIVKISAYYWQIKDILLRSLSPKNFVPILISNLLYLLLMALFYKILLLKLRVDLNVIQILFVMSIQVAILLLPIKSFGGFGTTEGSWMLGMMALGINRATALETGFIMHIVALLSAFIFFIIGLAVRWFLKTKTAQILSYVVRDKKPDYFE